VATILSSCAREIPDSNPDVVITKYVEVPRPAPIVPPVDQLKLKGLKWVVITPSNIDAKFEEIKNGEIVFFALTSEGYEDLSINLSNIRAIIEQHQEIIAVYENSYE
jgi:hypothetical protein